MLEHLYVWFRLFFLISCSHLQKSALRDSQEVHLRSGGGDAADWSIISPVPQAVRML